MESKLTTITTVEDRLQPTTQAKFAAAAALLGVDDTTGLMSLHVEQGRVTADFALRDNDAPMVVRDSEGWAKVVVYSETAEIAL